MRNSTERFLPIGSVVLLEKGIKKVMITGYLAKGGDIDNNQVLYDYMGCLYPEGVLSSNMNLLFNHADIKEIYAIGFSNEEQENFKKVLAKAEQEIKNNNNTVGTNN